MQAQILPLDIGAGFPQRFECRVAGVILGFEFRYNSEGDFYTVDIFDGSGAGIVEGVPVVYGSDILAGIVDDRLPEASIIVADTAGQRGHAGRGALGVDVLLWIAGGEA